jgi:small subunit ribosomal protein S6
LRFGRGSDIEHRNDGGALAPPLFFALRRKLVAKFRKPEGRRIVRRQRSAKGEYFMPFYEHVFLARQDLATAQVEALTEGFSKIITDGNGRVAKNEYWGLRSIAYRIKKNRKAHYVQLDIDAPAAAIAELERQIGLSEDVLRYMTVRVDELEAGPSAMMRRSERSERDGARGERGGFGGEREGGRGFGGDRPDRGDRPERAPRADGERGGFRPRAA